MKTVFFQVDRLKNAIFKLRCGVNEMQQHFIEESRKIKERVTDMGRVVVSFGQIVDEFGSVTLQPGLAWL